MKLQEEETIFTLLLMINFCYNHLLLPITLPLWSDFFVLLMHRMVLSSPNVKKNVKLPSKVQIQTENDIQTKDDA